MARKRKASTSPSGPSKAAPAVRRTPEAKLKLTNHATKVLATPSAALSADTQIAIKHLDHIVEPLHPGENESNHEGLTPVSTVPTAPFRFMELPGEIRNKIYRLVVPKQLKICLRDMYSPEVWVEPKNTSTTGNDLWVRLREYNAQVSVFLINKQTSSEALAILYTENTFAFDIDGVADHPVSMRSPRMFGPLGEQYRLHLLRNIRKIEITVSAPFYHDHWTQKRIRGRLDHFLSVLKEHADDESKRSLLTDLRVVLISERTDIGVMWSLESLTALNGIQTVEICHATDSILYRVYLPVWYRRCLELCIQGKSGAPPARINYPLKQIKKTNSVGRKVKTWVTTKKWFHAELDWRAFAERNGITIPNDVVRSEFGMDYFLPTVEGSEVRITPMSELEQFRLRQGY